MKNDFHESGILRVRCFSDEERRKLLETVESIGIPINDQIRKDYKNTSRRTAYTVDLKNKTIDDIRHPFIGAAMCSGGVRFYSVTEFCRLAELDFQTVPRFILFHIPHDGRKFPPELMSSVCIPHRDFETYHKKMRDAEVADLIPRAHYYQSASERFEISRLLCDVERFIGSEEPMEAYGMGFCYEKAYDGKNIKTITERLKAQTLKYYKEHHQRMDSLCERHPRSLLFDMHSYSDDIIPKEFLKQRRETPDVCIGTDLKFTPPELYESIKKRFGAIGYTTARNYPYSGCFVPNAAIAGRGNCISVMLEFNKRVYLDGQGKPDEKQVVVIRNTIEKIIADSVGL